MRHAPASAIIEILESRVAPANVLGTLVGTTLKISAPSGIIPTSASLVQLDPDSFDLLDGGPNPPMHFDNVHSVDVVLTDLNDFFNVILTSSTSRVPFSIKTGAGNDQIGVDGLGTTFGSFTVLSTGSPAVIFTANSSVRGDVKIVGAEAGGGVQAGGTLGNLSITGLPIVLLGGNIAGNVKITKLTDGVDVQASGVIHGNLTVTGGDELSKLTLRGITDGNIKLNATGGSALLTTDLGFATGGNLTVLGGQFTDTVNMAFSTQNPFDSAVHGAVVLTLGGGDNSVTIAANGRIASYLRITTGDQNDTVTLGNFLQVGGALQLTLGGGDNLASLTGVQVSGGMKYAGGAGADTVTMQNTAVLTSPKITLGDGTNSFTATVSSLENGLAVKGGIGDDSVFFGGTRVFGKATIALGDGSNQWTVTSSQLLGGFSYQGGIGNDNVTVDSLSILSGSGAVKGGDGSNVFVLQTMSFLSTVNYVGGIGGDVFVLGGGTAGFARIKASLGDGQDLASITNAGFLSLRVDGGAGTDAIERSPAVLTSGLVEVNFETFTILL